MTLVALFIRAEMVGGEHPFLRENLADTEY